MTNFRTDPNGEDPTDTRTGDVAGARPPRRPGLQRHLLRAQPGSRPGTASRGRSAASRSASTPRVDTVAGNVNQPYDANNWRLLTTVTTSPDGTFEALLPSTETFNCPIPQGPCPGMYLVKVDDPGTQGAPEPGLQPEPADGDHAGRGLAGPDHPARPPLDPISGTGCEDPAVPSRGPSCSRSRRPYVLPANAATRQADHHPGRLHRHAGRRPARPAAASTLTDDRTGAVTTLTRANGGIVSWTPGHRAARRTRSSSRSRRISASTFRPGPKQLTIITANANGGVSSVNGITCTCSAERPARPSPTTRPSSTSPPPPAPGPTRTRSRTRSTPRPPAACWCCRPASTTRTSLCGSR